MTEVIFRQLIDEISTLDKQRQIVEKSTDQERRLQAFVEALKYGGFVAQHSREAYGSLKEAQHKPASLSVTLAGVTFTWSLG